MCGMREFLRLEVTHVWPSLPARSGLLQSLWCPPDRNDHCRYLTIAWCLPPTLPGLHSAIPSRKDHAIPDGPRREVQADGGSESFYRALTA